MLCKPCERYVQLLRNSESVNNSERGGSETHYTHNGGNGGNHLAVIDLIRNEPRISLIEISRKTGISLRSVERMMSELKKSGTIERIGSSRTGYWFIK